MVGYRDGEADADKCEDEGGEARDARRAVRCQRVQEIAVDILERESE